MKNKTPRSKSSSINYDTNNISPILSIDLGNSETYRLAIEQIRLILDEDRSFGKLISLEVYNSKSGSDTSTFFMHRKDAYIVGYIDKNAEYQFPSDDQLRYSGQASFSLNNIYPTYQTIHMLGFAIAEAVRFYPIAEYIEILIEQESSSFDITVPIQNKEGKIWYLEEHRGSGAINTMTELTMKKVKTSWKATDGFNKYHLKKPITKDTSTPVDIIKSIFYTFKPVDSELEQANRLIENIQGRLKTDFTTSQEDLSNSAQIDPIKTIREAIDSHSKIIARCQNDLLYLENLREEIQPDYLNIQRQIERKKAQREKVTSKLIESEEYTRNFLEAIEEAIKLTTIQISMCQKLFNLYKVASHTNWAVPFPFHPEATGREAVVALNTTDNLFPSTKEPKTRNKGKHTKHKVSSRSSGDDDPDNDQGGEVIIKNIDNINKQSSNYDLSDSYFSWIYNLPKWLQNNFLHSKPIKELIETLQYNSRFIEKPKTLEKDLHMIVIENQDNEYEDNINQKAQISYEETLNIFDSYAIKSVVTIGIILPIFIEQKDPLLGLGNNIIEFY